MAHHSNAVETIGAHSAPQPPSYFQQKYGMNTTDAGSASKASGSNG